MTHHKRPEVSTRLARIAGHVEAIGKMVRDDRAYSDIVQQISAVKSALDSVIEVIIEDLLEGTINADVRRRRGHAHELRRVVSRAR